MLDFNLHGSYCWLVVVVFMLDKTLNVLINNSSLTVSNRLITVSEIINKTIN